jgi:hypothetical protein
MARSLSHPNEEHSGEATRSWARYLKAYEDRLEALERWLRGEQERPAPIGPPPPLPLPPELLRQATRLLAAGRALEEEVRQRRDKAAQLAFSSLPGRQPPPIYLDTSE